MSDAISSPHALDPDRPWIQAEEDLPAKMNWFETFFNPLGESPKLHFTRAWTVLFFAGVITWLGVGFAIFVIGVAGQDTSGISAVHAYLIAAVIGVSSLLSFVIHARRLNHAKKSSIRAIIILVPLIVGAGLFMGSVTSKAAEYQENYDARAKYLEDPAAWREQRLEERRAEQAKAEAERAQQATGAARAARSGGGAQGSRGPGQRRGRRGGGVGPGGEDAFNPENPLPSKESFILRPSLPAFYTPIAGLSALIMIWSLLWVARVPNFGREDKMAGQTEPYA